MQRKKFQKATVCGKNAELEFNGGIVTTDPTILVVNEKDSHSRLRYPADDFYLEISMSGIYRTIRILTKPSQNYEDDKGVLMDG